MAQSQLVLLSQRLCGLASAVNDKDAYDQFKVDKLSQMNLKSFVELAYFLLKIINEGDVKSIVWPVTSMKDAPIFMKSFHSYIDKFKIKFPWFKLPPVQKSQFQAPCPENAKVMNLLLKLTELSIFVVTGYSTNNITKEEIDNSIASTKNRITELESKIKTLKERLKHQLGNKEKYRENARKMVEKNIIARVEDFNCMSLLSHQEAKENILLQVVQQLDP